MLRSPTTLDPSTAAAEQRWRLLTDTLFPRERPLNARFKPIGEMIMATEFPEKFMLHIQKEIDINAPARVAFDALLEQLGPGGDRPDGTTMPMKLEPWPGGRWYRDLGNNAGHFWGVVQVIKPP